MAYVRYLGLPLYRPPTALLNLLQGAIDIIDLNMKENTAAFSCRFQTFGESSADSLRGLPHPIIHLRDILRFPVEYSTVKIPHLVDV